MFWSASSCSRAANATRSKIEGGSKSGRVTEIVDAVATLSCLSPKSVHDLEIWRDAISLLKCVYIATKTWPRDELYGLISQARRASVSIPTNLPVSPRSKRILRGFRFRRGSLLRWIARPVPPLPSRPPCAVVVHLAMCCSAHIAGS